MTVTVTTPPQPQMTQGYVQQGLAHPFQHSIAYPSVHWGVGATHTHEGCHGVIVDGGALEIRRFKGASAHDPLACDVVTGYGPGAWATFTNEAEDPGQDG